MALIDMGESEDFARCMKMYRRTNDSDPAAFHAARVALDKTLSSRRDGFDMLVAESLAEHKKKGKGKKKQPHDGQVMWMSYQEPVRTGAGGDTDVMGEENARKCLEGLNHINFPVVFPMAYSRGRFGFDVVMGSPPREPSTLQKKDIHADIRPLTGEGHANFANRMWWLTFPASGRMGAVLPRASLHEERLSRFREALLHGASSVDITSLVIGTCGFLTMFPRAPSLSFCTPCVVYQRASRFIYAAHTRPPRSSTGGIWNSPYR